MSVRPSHDDKDKLANAAGRILVRCFFFSSRRRHTRYWRDWSSDVCSSDLLAFTLVVLRARDEAAVRRLSGLCQLVGYGVGAAGPLAVGAVYAATGTWTARSEERRVGKEGRYRGSPYH